jgi:UPF0716 protein FxsA
MNTLLLSIVLIPVLEIYLFIKLGSYIGAFNTISLIFITAFIGVVYARHEGLNTLRSGFSQLVNKQVPLFELLSGTAIAFGAILLIVPGFATDLLGFLIIIPITRKFFLKKILQKYAKRSAKKDNYINGEFEDIENDDDRKI